MDADARRPSPGGCRRVTLHVLWYRCVACGYRVRVSGPAERDLSTYAPLVCCGKCRARGEGQFEPEEAA